MSTAALVAVAASQTWLVARGDAAGTPVKVEVSGSDAAPLALALALVALAAWGVVLVSGTIARRISLVLGAVASLGVLVVALALDADAVAERVLVDRGASSVADLSHRPWFWTTLIVAAAQLAVVVLAIRVVPSWPSMSSRYDAPTAPATSTTDVDPGPDEDMDVDELTFWKALDEGRDPTAR